jgi:hypothetical protein
LNKQNVERWRKKRKMKNILWWLIHSLYKFMICKKMIFVVYVLWWLFWGKLTTIFHLVVMMSWKIVGMLFNFNFIQSNKIIIIKKNIARLNKVTVYKTYHI